MSTTICMMKAINMPQNFWAEAVRHTIYILNSVPTKTLDDITPYEEIKQRKPNLENLRVFGCIAYAKVPSQCLTKLDDRSSRMVYLGNEQGSKAYQLFDPTTQEICVSRDVKFKENKTWDWKEYIIMEDDELRLYDMDNKIFMKVNRQGNRLYKANLRIAYAKVPSQRLTKLDDRSSRMVYLGNEQGSKAYQLFDPTTQKICVSRDVKFKENETWDWKEYINDLYENTEELLLAEDEPKSYKEALSDQKWIEAMKVELDSINRNNTWELTTLPKGHKAIDLKWVFKTKKDANGNIINHKARLVAKGYIQEHGIDSEEVFALEIDKFKAQMEEKFEMSDLGLLAYYLRIEVTQTSGYISIKQTAYANKILKKAGMIDCNETLIPMDPGTRLTKITEGTMVNSTEYQSITGCLRYQFHTRPDLSYSVGLLNRFMQEPREQHMKAIRKVLCYVKGTNDYGITYKHNEGDKIHGFSNSSYGVNTQEGKGTTGIIFYYGESPISWSTQKKPP
nr:ribonuclease H-like domain, reverse transcriptase, RNA-dependent DNA polymerase [Tanacetum cinerariifolium]